MSTIAKSNERPLGDQANTAIPPILKLDDSIGAYKHVEFEALLFSSIDSNLAGPLSLNLPTRLDTKRHHEPRKNRQDSKTSHRSSLHRSSSLVFRTLPPIRRMPSLQVPSLTDISNPHTIPTPRSLHQISETEATSYKRLLPLTLVHPNSPYVPWEAPVRQQILCPAPLTPSRKDPAETDEDSLSDENEDKWDGANNRDKKPIKHIWNALKSAPKVIKHKCQRLLIPRGREPSPPPVEDLSIKASSKEEQVIYYSHKIQSDMPYSPTASFHSTETNTLAIWLSERHRKLTDKDCESSKLMTIDEYDRVGSWIKPGDCPFSSRASYQCSYVDGDTGTVSSVHIFESEGDLASPSLTGDFLRSAAVASTSSGRALFGGKRIVEEERLSRIVHRASLRSYLVTERPLSIRSSVSNLAS